LIDDNTIKNGHKSLQFLSSTYDTLGLGQNNDRMKNRNINKDVDKSNNTDEKIQNKNEIEKYMNNEEKGNDHDDNSYTTQKWVRCLIVIEKIKNIDLKICQLENRSEKLNLPFIFKKNKIKLNMDNKNNLDSILFKGFQKTLFEATWRGGEVFICTCIYMNVYVFITSFICLCMLFICSK
jgi:hypothetical protein